MVVESLSAELERLYELDELKILSSNLLGLDPDALGGASAKGSFARALAHRCAELDAVDALVDVIVASRRTLPPDLVAKLRNGGLELLDLPKEGDEVGEFLVLKELGKGPTGSVYRMHQGGQDLRVRRLSRELLQRRRDTQRFFAAARLAGAVQHPAIPALAMAGALEPSGRLSGVAHEYVDGVPLSQMIAERGGRHLNELLPVLWAILEALAALHQAGVTHGALHAGNVLVAGDSPQSPRIFLLDTGAHHLRPSLLGLGGSSTPDWLITAAPELLRGETLGSESDVYSFGALVYQLMSGRGPFSAKRPMDLVLGHLTSDVESLTFTAAGNGASPEVDAFVRLLLDKDGQQRPRDASEAVEGLRRLWRASQRPPATLSDDQVDERFGALVEEAWDDRKAAELEALVDLGIAPIKLADGFYNVAREVRTKNVAGSERVVRRLLARAARLYEAGDNHDQAEKLYQGLVKLDPEDAPIVEALDRLRKKLGKYDELIESLIERTEGAKTAQQKSAYFAEIGRLYSTEMKDNEQALVAYAQAFCEDPLTERYAEQIERLAGGRYSAWEEVLGHCQEAAQNQELPAEARAALSYRMGRWYADRVSRPDLALPALNLAIELEPAHDRALAELCQLYRKAQQWPELGQTLLRRADVAPPNVARDLRAEAGEILASHLGNPQAALDTYQNVLAEDPGHAAAAEGLGRLLKQSGDTPRALKVLEGRANALSGEERHGVLLEIAEGYELELDKLLDAERFYRTVLNENGKHLDALRGLDRILTRSGRYGDLLEILQRQVELAVTARQKVALYERIAGVYDEEYLDHALAAEALETVLALDPTRASAAQDLSRHYRSLERWDDLALLYESQLNAATELERKVELGMQLGRVLGEHLKQAPRALAAYEQVLELVPSHAGALDALATLRALAGDSENAVSALDELAERAPTPEARAEQYLRAAAMLEARGEVSGALTRYKFAADACPNNPTITRKVRQKYKELGNYGAAVQLIEEELERTEGSAARAKLSGEMALICHRYLRDEKRASASAQLALHLDPTQPEALRVQGRIAYSEGRYTEAALRLEAFIPQLPSLDPEDAVETAYAYVDSLAESGATEKAVAAADSLLLVLAEDSAALLRVSELSFQHGTPEQTLVNTDLLIERHEGVLGAAELGVVLLRRGESLFKLGRVKEAIDSLERSVRADASSPQSFRALGKIYALREEWDRVIETRYRELELVSGDERVQTLIEIGEVASTKLNNTDYAARALLLALDERPNDRNILAKLMQLYSAHKDWPQLLEVIARLAEVVDDAKQRGKYLHTAAMLAARELRDVGRALEFVDLALEADPENETVFTEGLKLRRQARDYEGVKDLLKRRAQVLADREDKRELVEVLGQLGEVYEHNLARRDQAIRVFESLLGVDPENARVEERLANLYSTEPAVYFDQAVAVLGSWVRRDPYQPAPFKLLRKVYTEARRGDGAFLACQALHVLGHAEPDEERFFSRMRDGEPPAVQRRMTEQEWHELITPSRTEPLLTALFALVEPIVVQARAQEPGAFGLGEEHIINTENYPYGTVMAVHYAAEALGAPEPMMFQKPEEPGVLGFLPTAPPSILVGGGSFSGTLNPLEAAFIAGRHIAYYKPGLYLRQLLPNLTALKTWLFAAIRLVKAKFPVTPDLEAPVADASRVLDRLASGVGIEQLTHVVTKLLASETALDLKRWVHDVDFSADRAGLAVCHDLETAGALAQSLPAAQGSPSVDQRLENLVAYSVSEQYLELRQRQGVSLD